MFSDTPIESNLWNVIEVDRIFEERRQSRIYKWLLCEFFPDAEYSLYVDCNYKILTDINRFTEHELAMKPHTRDCIYDEAEVCKKYCLDYKHTIDKHISNLKAKRYPKHNGLHQGNIIFRKHTDKVRSFGKVVWDMINNGSHRDQLSLDFAAWKLRLDIDTLPSEYFQFHKHRINKRIYR